jgi:hypothetical protein
LKTATRKPRHLTKGKTEVGPAHFLEFLLAALGRDALHQGIGVRRLEHLRGQGAHVPPQAQHGGTPDGQVQVAGTLGANRLEQLIDQQRTQVPILSG